MLPQQRLQVTNRAEEQIGAYFFHQEGHYVRHLTASLSYVITSLLALALCTDQGVASRCRLAGGRCSHDDAQHHYCTSGFCQHPRLALSPFPDGEIEAGKSATKSRLERVCPRICRSSQPGSISSMEEP